MNDTFFYASADSDEVKEEDILKIIKIYKEYGSVGLTCWCAVERDHEPCIEYTEDEVYQNTWRALYGDLKLEINPMLEKDPDYRWGANSQLHLKPWEPIT